VPPDDIGSGAFVPGDNGIGNTDGNGTTTTRPSALVMLMTKH